MTRKHAHKIAQSLKHLSMCAQTHTHTRMHIHGRAWTQTPAYMHPTPAHTPHMYTELVTCSRAARYCAEAQEPRAQ